MANLIMTIVCQTISNGYFIPNTNTIWFLFLRLFSILTLLIIKIEFLYQKSLFNFYVRQISNRFYTIKQSQITSFSLVTCGASWTTNDLSMVIFSGEKTWKKRLQWERMQDGRKRGRLKCMWSLLIIQRVTVKLKELQVLYMRKMNSFSVNSFLCVNALDLHLRGMIHRWIYITTFSQSERFIKS